MTKLDKVIIRRSLIQDFFRIAKHDNYKFQLSEIKYWVRHYERILID